jgi:hypothetical protein
VPAQAGQAEHVDRHLTVGPHARRGDPLADLGAGERALVGERVHDGAHPAVRLLRAHPLLRQPAHDPGELLRRRQRVQPRVVLAADEVQRAAV